MATCLIGMGSNLGDRRATLDAATRAIASSRGVRLVARSRFHSTTPVGGPPGQPGFLNAALRIETDLDVRALWERLRGLEMQLGRVRRERWGPRTIDLDLLLYDRLLVREPDLEVPHPRMAFRRFVLAPAVEIAADMIDPASGWTVARLLEHLTQSENYIALAGGVPWIKRKLAGEVARQLSGRLIAGPGCSLATEQANAPSPEFERQIELAEHTASLLAPESALGGMPWAVSDFWFGELLATALLFFSPDEYRRFEERWRRLSKQVIAPKITVFLATAEGQATRPGAESGGSRGDALTGMDFSVALEVALERITVEQDQGPVLRLDVSDSNRAADEIVAAASAAQ